MRRRPPIRVGRMAWQWKSARRATRPEGTTLATPSFNPPLALRCWQPAILVRACDGPRQSACVCRICSDLCTCRRIGPAVTQWQARPFAPTRGVSRAAPTPTPRRGTPRGNMESVKPRRQRRVCARDKKAGDRRIDVRRCARVIADIDGHSITVSDRSLQGNRQTGSL